MSKLSKFRSHIRFDEAAALLSRLIDEPVSIDQLLSLHEQGWLSVYRPCFHELVHLRPALPKEEHEQHLRDGRLFMEPGNDRMLICGGFHYPYSEAYLYEKRVVILHTKNNEIYALRDIQTQEYLSRSDIEQGPQPEELFIETKDIYAMAEFANSDRLEMQKPSLVRPATCTTLDGMELYNLPPHILPTEHGVISQEKYTEDNSQPSVLLTISALLELAMNAGERKKNQERVITDIRDGHPDWKLSQSTLQKLFAAANNAAREQGRSP